MSRRRSTESSVSLFPFLAVLVCTMGALILLLLVTTKQARDQSVAKAMQDREAKIQQLASNNGSRTPLPMLTIPDLSPSPDEATAREPILIIEADKLTEAAPEPTPIPHTHGLDPEQLAAHRLAVTERNAAISDREREIRDLAAEWTRKSRGLALKREQESTSIGAKKRAVTEVSQKVASLNDELRLLERQLDQVTSSLPDDPDSESDTTEIAAERQKLELTIASLRTRLREAEGNSDSQYMILPFDPQSGTTRRPILIECTETCLKFMPEDVSVTPEDLNGFSPRTNPLQAGAAALVKYWSVKSANQPKSAREPEPYVLLLVRPNGIVGYYVAQRMLESMKQPYGYELIEEDTQLRYPPMDEGAKSACELAINRLLAERSRLNVMVGAFDPRVVQGTDGGGRDGRAGRTTFGLQPDPGLPDSEGIGSGGPGNSSRNGSGSIGNTGSPSQADGKETSPKSSGTGGRFVISDVMDESNDVGSHSWERIENFQGRPPRAKSAPQSAQDAKRSSSQVAGATETTPGTRGLGATVPSGKTERTSLNGSKGESSSIERLVPNEESGGSSISDNPTDEATGPSGAMVRSERTRRSQTKEADKPLEPEDLVGRRWGRSEAGAAIGLEKDVRIVVETDRLVVADKHVIRLNEGDSGREVFERLLTVLDEQALGWGLPPQGFFWTPRLRFVVEPEANVTYERTHSLVERAGLRTSMTFVGMEEPAVSTGNGKTRGGTDAASPSGFSKPTTRRPEGTANGSSGSTTAPQRPLFPRPLRRLRGDAP